MLRTRVISLAVGAATLAALAAPSFWSNPADAADRVRHHGSECLQMGTDVGAFNRTEYRLTRTGSGGSDRVICPVGLADDAGRVYADVYVNDSHLTLGVECSLEARDIGGNLLAFHSRRSYETNRDAELNLQIDHHGYNVKVLVCKLPMNGSHGSTKLYSYRAMVP